jgi:hypothetical protein
VSDTARSRLAAMAMLGAVSELMDEAWARAVRRRKNAIGQELLAISKAAGEAFDAITPDNDDFDQFAKCVAELEAARDRLIVVLEAIRLEDVKR